MPFDPEFDAVYTDLIRVPLTAAGYMVERADDVDARQNVLVDVVRGIADADLIIADLTSLNPNVFYELGLAHAMGVPTVLIAQQDAAEDIPFDLRQYRTEFYDTHFQRARAIVEVLERLGKKHATGELNFGSPISDFVPGAAKPTIHARRMGAIGSRSRESVATEGGVGEAAEEEESEGDSSQAVDENGLIDYLDGVREGSDELGEVATAIVEATDRVGNEMIALTARIEGLDLQSPTAATQGYKLLLQAAHMLDRFAEELELKQPDLEAAVDDVTSSGLGYLTLLSESPHAFRTNIESALETSQDLRATVVEARDGVLGLRESIATLPPMLKQTNRARNRAVREVDAILAQFDRVRSYAEQSIGLAQAALDGGTSGEIDENDGSPPGSVDRLD
jgi:hypothetical protein